MVQVVTQDVRRLKSWRSSPMDDFGPFDPGRPSRVARVGFSAVFDINLGTREAFQIWHRTCSVESNTFVLFDPNRGS